MFNFTYKEISKYIRKKDIDTVLSFSYSGFFKKFGVFILAMGFVFGLYAVGIGPAQGDWGETGNMVARILLDIVGPLVKISDCIFFLMLLAWVVIPYYNRGIAAVQGSLIGLVWCLTTFFSISSIITLVLVIVQGWISFFIQLFIMFIYFCVSAYYWFMKIHAKKPIVNNTSIIIWTILLLLIIDILMIIYVIVTKHVKIELALLSTMYILYIPLIAMLFYQLDRFFKVIYIQKYNEKFRVAYKIPDKEWWFTADAAAKHPRVYPSAKDDAQG
ncbi:beta-carotene 15,15'-monooxygenase [Ligilactobacillus salivarius]|uniref:beta-carotene 15,15'-monooxygenase n=1 Tax=Ligilactobacillus salivarius TaxID=1624 RepID=UPI0020749DF8|nr:beta-carotene 15,15'-monooxygenase [Ligilactobacillus salivarius]